MKLLAFDTSSIACSVGLSIDGRITEHHEIAPLQQASLILPMLDRLLKSEAMTLSDLDAIAFGCGPGSFTGLRIAASVAKGLAFGAGKRLIPVSSLSAMAQTAYQEHGWTRCLVAIDARMHEVYWAAYALNENHQMVLYGQEQMGKPHDIALPDSTWRGVGNAWAVYRKEMDGDPALIDPDMLPRAAAILVLAESRLQSGETVSAMDAMPIYLRNDVAKKSNVV
ncbi:MAG TPA: tRNA (adenosine(37)-N6)-threonylcarbamoyltransferase complex dimerization subunit type 1 TsaB [Gammaproteobacteria bacterium]|nr:tRNA (adenosine(37)-N6)-threonylcarbamoyltransferase complex dimerization subunit type 1 TsaB [Gammaproteobacteria bacterium]